MRRKMYTLAICVAVLAVAGWFAVLHSYVPQTIVVDGVNDFLLANLMDPDGLDCEFTNVDFDSVHVTNDANKLYIGFKYDKGDWTSNQLGIMFCTGPGGGTTDAWGRAIAWNTAPEKPDFQAYCNLDNLWQELRQWNSGTSEWDLVTSGTSSLGWVNNTGFEEVGFSLATLGLTFGDTVYIEIISTQDGDTKGPLDAMANDDLQLSTPTGTTWDVFSPVELDSLVMYIVQTSGDPDPPVVLGIAEDTPGSIVEPGIDNFELLYNEPVDETTAEMIGNYTLTGTTASITAVDLVAPERVRISVSPNIWPSDNAFKVEVTGVKDLAGNTIVDNGTTNVGCFFRKGILFQGLMALHLRQHSFPTDTLTVEGSIGPLTWAGCDNAFMTDLGDSTYELWAGFTLNADNCGGMPTAEENLEWKLMHQCTEYEPLSNRQYTLSSSSGAWDTLRVWWNDEDAEQFTTHPIDVIFTLDANSMSPTMNDTVAINGNVPPLAFTVPSITEMADDGNFPDDTSGDGVYAVKVRFPTFSFKNVEYKYLFNNTYECADQADRDVWLNDAKFDTVGGTLGPLEMPLQYIDRCATIGRDVEVIFTLNASWPSPLPGDTVAVNGTPNNQSPIVINWDIPSLNPMRDDGAYPDEKAGDYIYSTSITFKDSSEKRVDYKFLINSSYECSEQSDRFFVIDDAYNAVGNPQMLEVDHWDFCDITTGIGDITPAVPFVLNQNHPNPFNPTTTISFNTEASGRAVLRIYDVRGRLVDTLVDGVVPAGEVVVRWEAVDRRGREVASGIYFYELQINGQRATRKMVLLR